MAKKVKFPLKMADESRVSSLEELRDHFDLESVLGYYTNGRLTEWMEDRYYDEEADRIRGLDSSAPDFKRKLCGILGVEYAADESDTLDLSEIAAKNERRERLKAITADETILAAVDRVAFTQEELADLLDNDVKEIYLCDGPFKIPGRVENVTYIGINCPKADIPNGFSQKGIVLKNLDIGIEEILRKAEAASEDEAASLWRMAAELGSAEAQCSLGNCYYNGEVVEQDYTEAVKWYRKAAEQGYADAQNNLGECYRDGEGVEQDYAEAVKWFRKAVEQGCARAQNNLANCYYSGNGVEENEAEAVKWYRKAAEQEDADAQNNLGNCCYNGNGVKQDYAEAVKWYRKAAEQGNTYAQNSLGNCYWGGNGIEQDHAEAVKWYRKAAEQDYHWAQYNLANCYRDGDGVEQNYVEAVKWYRKAAEQGIDRAQSSLGMRYYMGEGVKQDFAEAVKWIRMAAEQGWSPAQKNLGDCYFNGNGVEQDYTEAIKWYRKAAEQGNELAQSGLDRCYEEKYREEAEQGDEEMKYTLGHRYETGDGVKKDYEEAVKWYRKAAEGHGVFATKAQLEMGLYYRGNNSVEANKWFRKVVASGIGELVTEAQWMIAQSYYDGAITEEEAKKLYRQAMKGVGPFASSAKKSLEMMDVVKTVNSIW